MQTQMASGSAESFFRDSRYFLFLGFFSLVLYIAVIRKKQEDFSEEKIAAAGIKKRFQNIDLEKCVEEIAQYIKG